MEDNEGIGYIFGLSTVLFGLTFIMSMGVYSANHPYKPGLDKCGEAPGINEPGILVYDKYEAIYRCPKDHKLQGVERRECILETRSWKPKGEDSLCVPDSEIQRK